MPENSALPVDFNPDDFVAEYLKCHPHYFSHRPDIFCKVIPPRQNREGTRSLLECQNEVLRSSLTTYELREEELRQREKELKTQRLEFSSAILDLAIALVSISKDYMIPETILEHFKKFFGVDKGVIRLWIYRSEFAGQPFTEPFSDEVESEISDMTDPFIGENSGSEIASWFGVPEDETKGVLLIPIQAPNGFTFGAICLTSKEIKPFKTQKAKDFLSQAIPLAQAALLRLTR